MFSSLEGVCVCVIVYVCYCVLLYVLMYVFLHVCYCMYKCVYVLLCMCSTEQTVFSLPLLSHLPASPSGSPVKWDTQWTSS